MRPVVRDATERDVAALAAVHVAGRAWAYRGLVPDALLDTAAVRRERETRWDRFVSQPPPRSLVQLAEHVGRPSGIVSAGPCRDDDADDSVAEIYSLYLRAEELAGHGLGRALMRSALARLRELDYATVRLWALATNERARRFYVRGGWRPDGAMKVDTLAGIPLRQARFRRALADRS
ncbi:MAG TPA: GNAT family N-acetyltransferase [Sandaracinaceae bacterium LLY-WYZ-13_1]|nr:GNAT family N-acetyltransferase [Sandaracinaceae bacterium LLY-WYZ-13_1]